MFVHGLQIAFETRLSIEISVVEVHSNRMHLKIEARWCKCMRPPESDCDAFRGLLVLLRGVLCQSRDGEFVAGGDE